MSTNHYIRIVIFSLALTLVWPFITHAQQNEEVVLKAQIVEIKQQPVETGASQHSAAELIVVKLLETDRAGEIIEIYPLAENLTVISQPKFVVGDKVFIAATVLADGTEDYFIVDRVRLLPLWLLSILFITAVLVVGRWHGLRSLVMLGLSFAIIVGLIIPQIIAGAPPVTTSIIGAIIIMALAIFGTEGWNKKTKVAFGSVLGALVVLLALSELFTKAAGLTGLWSEEAVYLLQLTNGTIDLRGLVLAGIVIGALGVLDDVIISQVSLVEQLIESNSQLPRKELFSRAMKVGRDHINAIVNTLFLAYAGAALPLLILFTVRQSPFVSLEQIFNHELIATEIIRTFVGSISLILAMPIATYIAVRVYSKK